jgi:hypothetical protein
MSKQILSEEFRRMQKLAGIITEEFKIGDTITIPNPDVNLGDEGKIIQIYANYNSIPKRDIGYYELDIDAYEEDDLNEPWYKIKQGNVEQLYSTSDLNGEQNTGKLEMNTYTNINPRNIKVDYNGSDYPEFLGAKITYAEFYDGTKLTDEELEELNKMDEEARGWIRVNYEMNQDLNSQPY